MEERLLHYLPSRPENACWIWTGCVLASGYGVLAVGHKQTRAHRAAYEVWVGPIPEGLTLDHVKDRGCSSILCCNPAHLEPVTAVENVRRGNGAHVRNARKEKCIRGHDFDLERRVGDKVYRDCSKCRRERGRRYDAKRRHPSLPEVELAADAHDDGVE